MVFVHAGKEPFQRKGFLLIEGKERPLDRLKEGSCSVYCRYFIFSEKEIFHSLFTSNYCWSGCRLL